MEKQDSAIERGTKKEIEIRQKPRVKEQLIQFVKEGEKERKRELQKLICGNIWSNNGNK